MKKSIRLINLLLVLVIAATLVGCSTFNKVDKALVEIGYEKIENSDEAEDMEKESEESEVAITVHAYSNANSLSALEIAKINIVLVLEFKATEDMKAYYEDSATLQGLVKDMEEDGSAEEFYNKLVEKGYANGNCLVISFNPLSADAVKEAIKNA